MKLQGEKIRVVIADDHTLIREGIRAILSCTKDIEVVGEASDGIEAIEVVEKLKPDVLLLDINMPRLGGLEAACEIRKVSPNTRILVLTQYDDKEYVTRFLKVGVSGYMLKNALGVELINAIKVVSQGQVYIHPYLAGEIVSLLLTAPPEKKEDPYDLLTDREKQVLKLLAEGYTHKEIADMLGISVKTVIVHRTNIAKKLDLKSKADIIKFAIQKGIIKLDSIKEKGEDSD